MTVRSVALGSAILIATVLQAGAAYRECPMLTAKMVMEPKVADLVFSGTVVEVTRTGQGYRASFNVDRVWKGEVTKRFDLYASELEVEEPVFRTGEVYVAVAERLVDPSARQRVGLRGSDAVAFTPIHCSHALAPGIRRELGRGQRPKN